jgi:hypothetical protein
MIIYFLLNSGVNNARLLKEFKMIKDICPHCEKVTNLEFIQRQDTINIRGKIKHHLFCKFGLYFGEIKTIFPKIQTNFCTAYPPFAHPLRTKPKNQQQ